MAHMKLLVAAAVPVLFVSILYSEKYATLQMPAPSFKLVGPALRPTAVAQHEGVFASKNLLHHADILYRGQIHGSESVAVNKDGDLHMLDKFAVVWKAKKGGPPQRLAYLGAGRPLGFHFDHAGNLIICNSPLGLQMLEKDTGKNILLATEAPTSTEGTDLAPIQYADDLAIASDGSIYFTDACDIPTALNAAGFYDTMASFILAAFQGEKTGRLLKYDPQTKATTFIAGGFNFANGVALLPDQSSAFVVETVSLRVVRIWLKGPKAGRREVFVDNLPGYPDGITNGSEGTYWLSLVSLNSPALETMLKTRITRWLAPRLPASLKKARLGTAIVQVSSEGKVLRYLDDHDGSHLYTISALTETDEGLYLGNLGGDFVSFLSRSKLPAPNSY